MPSRRPTARARSEHGRPIGTPGSAAVGHQRALSGPDRPVAAARSVVVHRHVAAPFCRFLVDNDPASTASPLSSGPRSRRYKLASIARRRTAKASHLSTQHGPSRLGMLRTFFDRIIEWDWADAPPAPRSSPSTCPSPMTRCPGSSTTPKPPGCCGPPRPIPDPLRRLVVELLARTGLRVGELCDLDADAVVTHRRRLVAAGPGRQAPQRPLRPAAPRTSSSSSPPGDDPRRRGSGLPARARRPAAQPPCVARIAPPGRHRPPARPRPPPPAAPHPGHPGHQPRDAPRGHRRPARSPQPAHDDDLRPDRQPDRRRRVPRRHRARSTRSTPSPTGRRDDRACAGSARAPAHARQRLVHPTRGARLRLRSRSARAAATSRPPSSSAPTFEPNATTPPRPRPDRPRRALRQAPHRPRPQHRLTTRPPVGRVPRARPITGISRNYLTGSPA